MNYPFVSIIVGIRNEEKYITECIESLLCQDYPKESYEIIIVDGMSTDNTRDIVKKFPVKLLLNEKKNVAAARNIGVKLSKGSLVAFTDGDCKADKSWLKTLVSEMSHSPDYVACVGGPNLVFDTDPVFGRVVGYAQETFLGSGGSAQSSNHTKKHYVQSLPNCNAMYKKYVIEEVGYFDEHFVVGQDGDLNHRIGKIGYKFLYVPESIVWHHRRATIKSFSVRMFKYGAWMAELFKKHGDLIRWYALLPPFAIIFTMVLIVGSLKLPVLIHSFGALLSIYLSLLCFASVEVIKKMKSLSGLLTFLLLPIQHVAYGFGMLFKFAGWV